MEKEKPFVLRYNPVFSIWPKPLLVSEYKPSNKTWVIEQAPVKLYITGDCDIFDPKTYCIESVLKSKFFLHDF